MPGRLVLILAMLLLWPCHQLIVRGGSEALLNETKSPHGTMPMLQPVSIGAQEHCSPDCNREQVLTSTPVGNDFEKPVSANVFTVDVKPLPTDEFEQIVEQVFVRIDRNGDGALSPTELSDAVEDSRFRNKEAQIVAALYKIGPALQALDRFDAAKTGITRADIRRLAQMQDTWNVKRAASWAFHSFQTLAGTKEYIDKEDLAGELGKPDLPDYERTIFQYLQSRFDALGKGDTGIRYQTLANQRDTAYYDTADSDIVRQLVDTIIWTSRSQKKGYSRDLYANESDPLISITPYAIQQGPLADCYFLAALGSLAKQAPHLILAMIEDHHNGTYTVTFPGARNEPITIKSPTEAEQGLYAHGDRYGTWPSVLEKAYGEYCRRHFWRRSPRNLNGGLTPSEGADGGSFTSHALRLLTGKPTTTDFLFFTARRATKQKLTDSFRDNPHRPVTASTALINLLQLNPLNWFNGHTYSVIGWDPDGAGQGTITVRDPNGRSTNSPLGATRKLSLADFEKEFAIVMYSEK